MMSARSAPSLRPSAPLALAQRTHSRATSGVRGTPRPQPVPGRWYTEYRGAAISFFALRACSLME